MGLFSKYLSSWVLAAILSGAGDAAAMWGEVHKQHLEVPLMQSDPISIHKCIA